MLKLHDRKMHNANNFPREEY